MLFLCMRVGGSRKHGGASRPLVYGRDAGKGGGGGTSRPSRKGSNLKGVKGGKIELEKRPLSQNVGRKNGRITPCHTEPRGGTGACESRANGGRRGRGSSSE